MPGYDEPRYEVVRIYPDGRRKRLHHDEFFVLRRGDILALGTLWSYVHNARLIVESNGSADAMAHQREHLVALADDVSDLAIEWATYQRKLPD